MKIDSSDTYYEILNISKDANEKEIYDAYRKTAKLVHPDVCKEPDADELFKTVNEAYCVLSDPAKRAVYDAKINNFCQSNVKDGSMGSYNRNRQDYRDPSSWYYKKDRKYSTSYKKYAKKQEPLKESLIPRKYQVIMIYLMIAMAVIIFAQLILVPWISGVNETEAAQFLNEGNKWLEEQEFQLAINSYKMVVERKPEFAYAWYMKGTAEYLKAQELESLNLPTSAKKYYDSAAISFVRTYKLDENNTDALKQAGIVFIAHKKWDEASAIYKEILRINPNNKEAEENLARIDRYKAGFEEKPVEN